MLPIADPVARLVGAMTDPTAITLDANPWTSPWFVASARLDIIAVRQGCTSDWTAISGMIAKASQPFVVTAKAIIPNAPPSMPIVAVRRSPKRAMMRAEKRIWVTAIDTPISASDSPIIALDQP